MKKSMKKTISYILVGALVLGLCSTYSTVDKLNAVKAGEVNKQVRILEETTVENESTGEQPTEEATTEEPTTEEPTEEPTTEEPTTEEPTTVDYVIINDVYKVRNNELIEYLGDKNDETVTDIVIPKSVKKIKGSVFKNCRFIEEVDFEKGSKIESLGNYCFQYCEKLKKVTLPSGLKTIGKKAFGNSLSLEALTIPATVTKGNRILGLKSNVKKVTFSKNAKNIPENILRSAQNLEEVDIKSGPAIIENRAFYGCKKLKKITIAEGIITIGTSVFNGCTSIEKLTLPSSVQIIGAYCFKNCTGITTFTIPKNTKSIGKDAFAGINNILLKVYANSGGKHYARVNNIKWDYTNSEKKRQAKNKEIYENYIGLISNNNKNKYRLSYLTSYVPQGICIFGRYLIVSMYHRSLSKNSILLVYDKNSGAYIKQIVLPSRDHVGSVVNVKGKLVIGLNNLSYTDYVAVISAKKIQKIKSGQTIKYDYKIKISGHADFASYDGKYFWAGHSVNSSYGKMYGYKVSVKKKKLKFKQKYVFTVPANTQGLSVVKNGSKRTFVCSSSYGTLPNSNIYVYNIVLNKAKSLGKPGKTITVPAMLEGVTINKANNIYMVFESAAHKYTDNPEHSTEIRISNICKMKLKDLLSLHNIN